MYAILNAGNSKQSIMEYCDIELFIFTLYMLFFKYIILKTGCLTLEEI